MGNYVQNEVVSTSRKHCSNNNGSSIDGSQVKNLFKALEYG